MLTAFAAGKATSFLEVTGSGMKDSEISYTISLKPNVTKFSGAILNIEFDPTVLELKNATPVFTLDEDGNTKYNLYGEYVHGFVSGSNRVYAVAYMNNNGVTTGNSEYKHFFNITFKVITNERPSTTVKFTCKEIFTNDDVDNDIRPTDAPQVFKELTFSTLDNPILRSATLLENGIKFEWDAVEGAEEYSVLRKASNEGVWHTIAELGADETSYIDTDVESGVKYTYSAKSGNGYGDSGFYSAGVSQLYLEAATITSVSNVNNSVRITWGAVGGAESYAVYRQDSDNSEWALLEKTASQKLYYEDESVASNNTYKYAVAVENGQVSTQTGLNSVSHRFMAAPIFSESKNIENGIKLSWNSVAGVTSYELYRKLNANDEWQLIKSTDATGYLDEDVTNGTTYIYSLKTVGQDASSSMNIAATVARIEAPVITGVGATGDGVDITWNKVNGATGYTIYRKARGENEWQVAGSVGTGASSYKDTTLNGGYYTYAVVATLNNTESAMTISNTEIYFLCAPKNVVLENTKTGIKISWSGADNAASYQIKRKDAITGEVIILGESKTPYFMDETVENLLSYAYSVTAIDSMGVSSESSAFTIDFCRVVSPEVLSATPETNAITLVWDAISGVESYNIYRKTDGNWSKITTVGADVSSYKDTSVTSGIRYSYTVTAVKNNTESYLVDENSKSATYVNKPSNLKASLTAAGVSLSWQITDDLTNFVVYKRVKGNAEWSTLTKTNSSVTTIHDTAVKSGTTYEYAIQAISNDGTFTSGLSDIKSVTFLSKIATVKVSNIAGGVKVTWSAVKGAKNYIVYRRLTDGTWKTLKKVSASTRSFTDKTAVSNKEYYYTVRAEANGYKSAYQNYPIYHLAAPKITGFDSQIGKGITVKWSKVAGATQYYVYRKTGDSKWKKIGTTKNLLFLDKNVKLGTTYIYMVKANGKNVTSSYYADGWKRQFTPGTPTITSISSSSKAITIKWGKVSGVSGYKLYRKANGDKKWTSIATIKGTSYTDKAIKKNVKYIYTIKSYKGKVLSLYNKTGWSGAVLSASSVKIANASTGVKVSWSKNNAATSYIVYRGTYDAVNKKWSSWKNMGTIKASKTSWVDTSAQSGTTYRYTVKTVCGSCKSSVKASAGLLYLKMPKVTISNASNGITVKWTQALQSKGYIVYRAQYNTKTKKWSSWETMVKTKSSANSWVDKSVKSGVTYKYTVKAFSGKTTSTNASSSSLKYLSTPQLVNAFRTAEGIVVTYQQVAGAEGYRIYRKTDDTSWAKIADVKGKGTVNYTDNTVDENTSYTYTVKAFSGKHFSYYDKNGVSCK